MPDTAKGLARELLRAWVHLAVLWAFAVAKPLFDVLADSPEFFVARGNTRADILVFSIGLILIPPLLLVAVELAAARLPVVRRSLHLLFVLGLSAAFAVQLLDDAFGGSSAALAAGAALLGLAAAFAYARTRVVPTILTVLGPAPLVFLLLFLLGSSVSKLVLPQDAAGAADADVRSDTPVVMVVFDELDPNMLMNARERIDRTRYPNIAAFADDATRHRNATTVNGSTTQAVPGLLSSTRETTEKLPIAADYPNNLFTLVSDSHELNVVETATEICPERLCGSRSREPFTDRIASLTEDLGIVSLHLLAPEGMRPRLPAVDRTFGDFAGDGDDVAAPTGAGEVPGSSMRNRRRQFDEFIAGVERAANRPSLNFIHTVLPHLPWEYMPTGQQYVNTGPDSPGLENEQWPREPFFAQLGLQRHLLQLGYVDKLVGRLVSTLRKAHIYDRALVVLTADHGVSYRPGLSRRIPEPGNGSDIAAVPLLIKYPGREGRVDDGMVQTLQVVPTIARALGTELPWAADGQPIGSSAGAGMVRVARSNGESFELRFEDFVRQRRAGLRRLIRLFGADDGGAGLYANGPGAEILGRPVSSLPAASNIAGEVVLDSAELLDDYRRGSLVVPSYVTGRLAGDVPAGTPLAIAVNDRVAATTRSFSEGGDVRIAGLVPPQAFSDGANDLELFAILEGGSRLRLAPLDTQRPRTYRLVESDGRPQIVGGGRTIRVEPGLIRGYVESAELNDQGLRISGWALNPEAGEPADRVLAFQNGRLVAQTVPQLDRPDVAEQVGGPESARAGYDMGTTAAGAEPDAIRVFAVSGGVASELQRLR